MSRLSRSADTAQAYEDKDDIEKFLPLALALSQADFFLGGSGKRRTCYMQWVTNRTCPVTVWLAEKGQPSYGVGAVPDTLDGYFCAVRGNIIPANCELRAARTGRSGCCGSQGRLGTFTLVRTSNFFGDPALLAWGDCGNLLRLIVHEGQGSFNIR